MKPSKSQLLSLALFSLALFAPMMGRGFVLDDFGHLFVAANESVHFGLTRAAAGVSYAPVAWLSFKIDWLLWGTHPYPYARDKSADSHREHAADWRRSRPLPL